MRVRDMMACFLMLMMTAMACAPQTRSTPEAQWAAVDVEDVKAFPLGPYGGLQHNLRITSSDGRTLRLRGKVRNPYDGSVDGVRIVIQILASPPPEGRELERHDLKLTDLDLGSGAATAIGRDVQTMYSSSKFIRVAAFAIKRDGTDQPPPPDDLGGADAVQFTAMGVPIPESMAGQFFSGF